MNLNLNSNKYSSLFKWEIVLICLYQLGGTKKKIHTEEIAFKAFRIKAEDFSWTMNKFSKYPDLEPTRKALFKLRTEKKVIGAYATELNKDGWILTESGLEECLKRKDFLDIKKNKSNPQQFDKSKVISIKRSDYYKSFIGKKDDLNQFDIYHVADFLKIRADNIPNLREVFFKTKTMAKIIDHNIYSFLEFIQSINNDIFDEQKLLNESKVKSKSKSKILL
jgi:hypothetical protein